MYELIHHLIPKLLPLEDLNFDSQVVDGDSLSGKMGHSDGIFLGGQNAGDSSSLAALDEAFHLPFGITVMVRKTLDQIKLGTETAESLFKTLR